MSQRMTWAQVEAQNAKVFNNRLGKPSKEVVERLIANLNNRKPLSPDGGLVIEPKPIMKTRSKSGYNKEVVLAYFKECGVPEPVTEYKFAHTIGRLWRFDFAWCSSPFTIYKLALECQGGIFIQGRHSRGAALLKEWEKLNTAAEMGWRILYCQPSDLCTQATVDLIKRALDIL